MFFFSQKYNVEENPECRLFQKNLCKNNNNKVIEYVCIIHTRIQLVIKNTNHIIRKARKAINSTNH